MNKILCSGEVYQDPIDTGTCLECALKRGVPPCGMTYGVLKAIFKSQDVDRSNEVHVTDLTGCLLKAYYDKTEPAIPYVHELLIVFYGIAVHDYIERALEGDPNVEAEIDVEGFGVKGRIDQKHEKRLIDLKTSRWLNLHNLPYGSHADQVNYYAKMLGAIDQLTIQYLDMSGATTCNNKGCDRYKMPMRMVDGVVICPSCQSKKSNNHLGALTIDIPVFEEVDIEERAQMLRSALDTGKPPEPEPSWLCKYCHAKKCVHNPEWGFE
jgi:hypothetical protein